MENIFTRTQNLLGSENLNKLKNVHIAIFGLGGVGSYVAEALCRCGVYKFTLFDKDQIVHSNINRQIIALHSTIGMYKTEIMKQRMLDINPEAEIEINTVFYLPDNAKQFPLEKYSYIVDAIDTVTAKICLIKKAQDAKVPIISSMGMGNKLDPTRIKPSDIYSTSVCPLAKVMRKELKAIGIKSLDVVFSDETPVKPVSSDNTSRKQTPSSISFVPSSAGLIIAAQIIKNLVKS